jgi:hypothetical protein
MVWLSTTPLVIEARHLRPRGFGLGHGSLLTLLVVLAIIVVIIVIARSNRR